MQNRSKIRMSESSGISLKDAIFRITGNLFTAISIIFLPNAVSNNICVSVIVNISTKNRSFPVTDIKID